jgi:hypothetical protein
MKTCCCCGVLAFVLLALTITALGEDVYFPDAVLETDIRWALEIPAPTPITTEDMAELRYFGCSSGVASFEGLQYAVNLDHADLGHGQVNDLSPLAGLTRLDILNLVDYQITDVSPLSERVGMLYLNLRGNRISDVSALSGMTVLGELELGDNLIAKLDFTGSEFEHLGSFNIGSNPLSTVILRDSVVSQQTFDVLMNGGGYSYDVGIAQMPEVLSLDMGGVDFLPLGDLSSAHTMDDLEELLLVGATNLDDDQLLSLVDELDSLKKLDVTGPWDDFGSSTRESLNSWGGFAGNTLIVPEPATMGLLGMGGLAILKRRIKLKSHP